MSEKLVDKGAMSRSRFLRVLIGASVGAAAGVATQYGFENLGEEITERTGIPTGNAGLRQQLTEQCPPEKTANPNACADEFMHDPVMVRRSVIVGPAAEELAFRAAPSLFMDVLLIKPTDPDTLQPIRNLVSGTGNLRMSRREAVVGMVTSLMFAAMHNVTRDGTVDAKTVPLQQFLLGGVLWYLQRTAGVSSNTVAHVVYNLFGLRRRAYRTGWSVRRVVSAKK